MKGSNNCDIYSHIPYLKVTPFQLKKIDYFPKNEQKTVPLNVEPNKQSKRVTWYQFAFYIQLVVTLILYLFLESLSCELKKTKETMYEFHMTILKLNLKGLEVEKNCLSELANFREFLGLNPKRVKRDAENSTIFNMNNTDSIKPKNTHLNKAPIIQERIERNINDRRGKQAKRKHKRRRYHGYSKASHFIGYFPQPTIKDRGLIAPWTVHSEAIKPKEFHLAANMSSNGRAEIRIPANGLYFIYAQVYYITPSSSLSKAHNSFYIMLKSNGKDEPIAQCATLGDSTLGGETSCFTAVARSLNRSDYIYLKQREKDRLIVMKPEQTFVGLILLSHKS